MDQSPTRQASEQTQQHEQWTRDVSGIMAIVIVTAAMFITAANLAGLFRFIDTLPIYVLLACIVPAWWAARRGGWRWARFFPVLLCFGLGAYSTYFGGFHSLFVLFYALAVLLSGMLVGNPFRLAVLTASIIAYGVLGIIAEGFSTAILAYLITFSFGLVGVALLQSYTLTHLQSALKAQIQSNAVLQAEIDRRRVAERLQHEQEGQLVRLANNTTDLVTEIDPTGTILYASPSYQTGLGYPPQGLLGSNAFDLVHPDDLEGVLQKAQDTAVKHAPEKMQMRVRRSDGVYIHMEVAGNPLYDPQGNLSAFVLSSRDIHLQKLAEMALQESERKFRSIIESLPFGVHMFRLEDDSRLIFTGYNPAADSILNRDHGVCMGQTLEELIPEFVSMDIPARLRDVARRGGGMQVVLTMRPEDGPEQTFDVHAFQAASGSLVVIFTDISGRIEADRALRLSEQKYSAAFIISPDSVNINRLADGVYLNVNQGFTRLMGYASEEVLGKSSVDLNIWADPLDRQRLVQGLREHGFVENLEARFRRKNGHVGIGLMSARVIEIEGEMCILSITRDITARIEAENSLRENEARLRETHRRLTEAYDATLQGWARALELRERETADHSQRVAEQTLRVGRSLGLTGQELVDLERGALLHDIGKLGVPDQILLKPGPLTSEEWVIMRMHTVFGRNMLTNIEYLRSCITIPYSHHERWDGTGYPQGLKGEDIPLAARVFALVDVYDALTHDRPYRPAWPKSEAIRHLVEQSGKHFDPRILEVFLAEVAYRD